MPLTSVQVSEDVWLTCLVHSLTTETEEIMGLLFGDIQDLNNGNLTALIWGASPQMRSDRRKDRVETNPEQLAAATAQAEMSQTIGRTTRVIGWYHSHPHITVLPSHVDVRTQAMYQMLDRGFIGLIFSCFNEDAQKVGRIQVIAFQSADSKKIHGSPARDNAINVETSSSWGSFENSRSASESAISEANDQDTGDSRMTKAAKIGGRSSVKEQFCTHKDIKNIEKQRMKENSVVLFDTDNLHETLPNSDSIDTTDSFQEALHRSSMEISSADYIRMEVPLIVLPTRALLKLESPLSSFTDLQHMLFEEEQSAYKQAVQQNIRDGKIHPLSYVHHTSTYQASLCKLIEYCLSPAVNVLQDRLRENETRLGTLLEEARSLERELIVDSPRRSRAGTAMLQRETRASEDSSGSRSPGGVGISSRMKTP